MAKSKIDEFDQIVQGQLQKSVVVAPSDPNGGAKLPYRQKNKAKEKDREGEQYMAVFDREAQESNDQLEDWMRETNETTGSPEKFVNDDDDKSWAEDPDHDPEDSRGADVYDPYTDDEEEEGLEDLDDEDMYTYVRAHKRRKVKKAVEAHDMDGEDINLSDEDDDDLDEGYGVHQHHGVKHIHHEKGDHKHHGRRHFHIDEMEEEDEEEDGKEKDRRRQVRKALGADAVAFADASPLAKALIDALFDFRDDTIAEIRTLTSRVMHMEKSLRVENRKMTKSLAAGMAQIVPRVTAEPISYQEVQPVQQGTAMPIRKGYGLPPATTQKFAPQFNLAKSLDALEEAFQKGVEGVSLRDITILENDKSPQNLSNAAQEVLRKAGLLF